ncbi:hypothetical protein B5180_07935 [Streptomyces sp. BF-3]|nr:hypothetical protein B5180_07935 [Streptomyces sp. BF-3]
MGGSAAPRPAWELRRLRWPGTSRRDVSVAPPREPAARRPEPSRDEPARDSPRRPVSSAVAVRAELFDSPAEWSSRNS